MFVKEKELSEYPFWIRPFFWSQRKRYGKVLKPGLVWARQPRLFAAVAALYGVLDRGSSPISPILRSLVTVRVSQVNHCAFCVDINASTLIKRSGSEKQVEHLADWRNSDRFDKKEKTVLEYVEAITYTDQEVTADLMARLKEFFDDDGVVELTGLIAFQNLSSKFNAALDIPPEGFCQLSEKISTLKT